MRYFAVLIAFFMTIGLNAQSKTDINKFDTKGKRHGVWKGTYETTGRLRYEGTFDHGVEKGTFKFYDDTQKGSLIATRDFSAGNGVSYTTFIDQKGNKVSEGKEVNKVREGEWKVYHPDGKTLMSLENYSKGKLNGLTKIFFANGAIAEEKGYKDGVQDGIYKKYNEKGTVLEDSNYKNGKLNGQAVFYDKFGNVSSKGEFVKGYKYGYWEYYDNKKLVKKEFMIMPKEVTRD